MKASPKLQRTPYKHLKHYTTAGSDAATPPWDFSRILCAPKLFRICCEDLHMPAAAAAAAAAAEIIVYEPA